MRMTFEVARLRNPCVSSRRFAFMGLAALPGQSLDHYHTPVQRHESTCTQLERVKDFQKCQYQCKHFAAIENKTSQEKCHHSPLLFPSVQLCRLPLHCTVKQSDEGRTIGLTPRRAAQWESIQLILKYAKTSSQISDVTGGKEN